MPVALNHTIVHARDAQASAAFFTELFGLPPAVPFGHFLVVHLDNGVSLDFMTTDLAEIPSQHYAFLIGEDDFDAIYGRILERGITHWAEPWMATEGINTNDGGRGTYFAEPSGHWLEILTVPYGGWPDAAAN